MRLRGDAGPPSQRACKRRALVFMATMSALLVLAVSATAEMDCSGEVSVGGDDAYEDAGVSIDVAHDGVAWAAWMGIDHENGDEEIYFSRYASEGWTARQRLHGENTVADRFPELSIGDDGVVWVVWYKWSYTGARLYVSHGGAGGWSAPEPVHPGAGRYDDKTIFAIDSTNVWMAAASYVSERGDYMIVAYHWQGTAWEGPWQIGVPGTDSDYPDFALDQDGNIWLVWFAMNPLTANGPIIASTWTGSEWTDYEVVGDDTLNAGRCQIVLDGDVPMVTWVGNSSTTHADVLYSRREGGSWTPSELVNQPDEDGDWDYNRACESNDAGMIAAVWDAGNDYHVYSPAIYMSWWNGDSWSLERRVSNDDIYTIDRFPDASLDEYGGLWIAWSHHDDNVPPWDGDLRASVCMQTTPVSFGPAVAEAQQSSVLVSWLASGEAADGPFDIWRCSEPVGGDAPLTLPPLDAVVLNEAPLTGPPHEWIDQSPEPGLLNSYWVSWDAPGGVRYAGPSSVLVDAGPKDVLPARVLFVRPNPTRSGSCFHLKQSDAGHVEVALYTVGGRAVRTLESVSVSALGAESDLCWDGLDDSGERVASGAYVWELRFNGSRVPEQNGVVTVVR